LEETARRLGIVLALCGWVMVGIAGGGSTAVAATWHLQGRFQEPGEHLGLLDVSCPTKSLCVAVGEGDEIVSSSNPDGGPSAWRLVHPFIAEEDNPPFSPPPGFPNPNPQQPGMPSYRTLRGVSCPTTGFCVAVTFDGYIFHSSDPTGGVGDWQVADTDGKGRDTHLMAVSCPSVNLCVAVSGDRYTAGKVLSSTNPGGGDSAWKVVQLDESLDLRGISCGTPSFCVAVAQEGRLLVSTNPTGGASAWTEVGKPGGPGNLHGVSCAAIAFCVAGNSGGNLLSSTSPDGAASTWDEVNGGASVPITDVDCLPTSQCLAVDNNGNVLTANDATAGRDRWSLSNLITYTDPGEHEQPLNAIFGVACHSSSFCALSTSDGRIYTSDNPFATTSDAPSGAEKKTERRPRVTIATAHAGYRVRGPHMKSHVFFRFHANGRVRGFLCARDHSGFKPCHSPVRYRASVGRHVFRVRAIGLTGLRGPAATDRFRVEVNPNVKR
jgi:hypothetical protein